MLYQTMIALGLFFGFLGLAVDAPKPRLALFILAAIAEAIAALQGAGVIH